MGLFWPMQRLAGQADGRVSSVLYRFHSSLVSIRRFAGSEGVVGQGGKFELETWNREHATASTSISCATTRRFMY